MNGGGDGSPMQGVEQVMNGGSDHPQSHYAPVWYKKNKEGSLTCSATSLLFRSFDDEQQNNPNNSNSNNNAASSVVTVEWKNVTKHQVSPATYPKSLLKIILSNSSKAVTFQMKDREELERIRKDITNRLQQYGKLNKNRSGSNGNKKRPHSGLSSSASFGLMDKTATAVTRSALLAANAALRQQHKYLVTETNTVSEDDFWQTHQHLVEEEYARMAGLQKAGTSSLLQSHLPSSGRVTLGVQEMRQIFVLYPAVHRAYEAKVPLELSDEQFWRKYLESEYFHRDRGRIGTASRNHSSVNAAAATTENSSKKDKDNKGPSYEQQEARAAAVGTDDLFSRYDQKIRQEEQSKKNSGNGDGGDASQHRRWGQRLAVGQFDLASTFETERGHLLEGPKDNHPLNANDSNPVISKYNRHWQMVLNPDEAIAGTNLLEVARRSVHDVLPNDSDAAAQGGLDEEMRRLVHYCDADETEANHAVGVSGTDAHYEPLTLQHVEAYYNNNSINNTATTTNGETNEAAAQRHTDFARAMAASTQSLVQKLAQQQREGANNRLPDTCFPPPEFGRELLTALTKKMAKDSQTEAESLDMVQRLPDEFRDGLQAHFRRSSELLRHFFGLRRLVEQGSEASSQKLARIVGGMERLYREMEEVRRGLPQNETGETMRKMYLPIMEQLDWAFRIHREGSGGGGGGGFVAV